MNNLKKILISKNALKICLFAYNNAEVSKYIHIAERTDAFGKEVFIR